ncbi:hypothetical protein ACFL42_00170 [Candidatus Omnitrophota bacterium]
MERFTKDGRWIIPLSDKKVKKDKGEEKNVRYLVSEAYCPNGCSIIDEEHKINGAPGLKIKCGRPGVEGAFVISAIEGDFDKIILSGELADGVKDDLYCPHCGVKFETLVNCNCKPDADMVIIGLTPKLDINNAITFCNVTGCCNGAFIKAGEVLRHVRLGTAFDRKKR